MNGGQDWEGVKQDELVLFSLSAQLFSLSFERGHSFVVGGRAGCWVGQVRRLRLPVIPKHWDIDTIGKTIGARTLQ